MAFVPEIDTEFAMIADWKQPELTAVISSYIVKPGRYSPIFAFPAATASKSDRPEDLEDEHAITRLRSPEFDIFSGNALKRIGGCKTLILAGLSENQKSYLTFLRDYNVIEIQSQAEADFLLGAFEDTPQYLPCRPSELANGLAIATDHNLRLRLDENAPILGNREKSERNIIVVVENCPNVATVIAINYALSIHADIKVVEPLREGEENEIRYQIEDWQRGSAAAYGALAEKVNRRVWDIEFSKYSCVTFFTYGLPYSLIIKDIIPCTYVHFLYRPDFFIFNNIFFEKNGQIGASVVFSPQVFSDEETNQVIEALEDGNFYVRKLVGKDGTAYNIEMHVKEFPYDFLHICSHGGEIGGYTVMGEFDDRDENHHTYEFDEVVSFAPVKGEELIPVTIKRIFRKFDGLIWKSPELHAKPYPHYVFSDMYQAIRKAFDENKEKRATKPNIPGSCAIKCSDFNYQAMFHVVAGIHTAPVIFNNSCWSWTGIAENFLVGGSRGYIGTLWNIGNDEATKAARLFYRQLFLQPISDALHAARSPMIGTRSENIYIYWGLHFSSIKKCYNIDESREKVVSYLLRAFYTWLDMAQKTTRPEIRQNIEKLSNWISSQLSRYFRDDYMKMRSEKGK